MNPDIFLLFSARVIRLFAYGFLSVVLALYLSEIGFSDNEIGLLLSLTLIGDVAVSLWITTITDRVGRKRMLIFGSVLMAAAGIVFVLTKNPVVLTLAAILGIISPSGNEIGPFLSIEQAALSQLAPNEKRTSIFAWYNLAGFFATAAGALCSGWLAVILKKSGFSPEDAYRVILSGYAVSGLALALLYSRMSSAPETQRPPLAECTMGLHQSRPIVIRLSALFALDAFAGGFIIQSMMVYWFHIRFNADTGVLGSVFFGANILSGLSALLAARIAKSIGLINTMVFTHIPSNILLCLVPLMPNLESAVAVLLLRFTISQMDVPTRQSYTMAVVAEDERTAAAGITNIARSIGASFSPALCGLFLAHPALISGPFFLAGGLKIIYDVALFRMFKHVKPPEENIDLINRQKNHCNPS
jgi:MFS family permease